MQTNELKLEFSAVQHGFVSLIPLSLFVLVFGAAFGLAASQQGLSETASILMSILVFAGASQFGALELWDGQIPVVTLAVTVFAINARHLLIGATLYPHIRTLNPITRYGVMLVASDANWAMSMKAFNQNEPIKALGLLFGGGVSIWIFWVIGTWFGFYFGNAIRDPYVFGVDMVMGCFLLTMVFEGKTCTRTYIIWVIAATASIAAYLYLPKNSHVIIGALAGGVAGVMLGEKTDEH